MRRDALQVLLLSDRPTASTSVQAPRPHSITLLRVLGLQLKARLQVPRKTLWSRWTGDLPVWQILLLLVLESEFLNVVMSGTTPWNMEGRPAVVCLLIVIHHSSTPHAKHCANTHWRHIDGTCCSCPEGALRLQGGWARRRLAVAVQRGAVGATAKLWVEGQERQGTGVAPE